MIKCNSSDFTHKGPWQRHYSGCDAGLCCPRGSVGSRLVSAKQNMMAMIFTRVLGSTGASFCQSHLATVLTVWCSKSLCPQHFFFPVPSLFCFRAPGVFFNYLQHEETLRGSVQPTAWREGKKSAAPRVFCQRGSDFFFFCASCLKLKYLNCP